MIKNHTVFITGAGASKEFNFPTGPELTKLIIEKVDQHAPKLTKLKNTYLNFQWQILKNFRENLYRGMTPSIDTYVRVNSQYREYAQFFISVCLLDKENESEIFDNDKNYLRFIWQEMIKDCDTIDQFIENQVTFVTFNYDRSLRFFFQNALKAYFLSATAEQIEDAMSKICIFHLYGNLDDINTLNPVKSSYIQYGSGFSCEEHLVLQIKNLSKNVFLNHDSSCQFETAFEKMQTAIQIFILGFGFEMSSFEKLNLHKLTSKQKIHSSAIGLANRTKINVRQFMVKKQGQQIIFRSPSETLYQILQENLI